MPAQENQYEYGQCPLSRDGICEAEHECPYGCNEKVRIGIEEDRAEEELIFRADPRLAVLKLLIATAQAERLKELRAPNPVLRQAAERVKRIATFLTPEIWTQFHSLWPEFLADYKKDPDEVLFGTKWVQAVYGEVTGPVS